MYTLRTIAEQHPRNLLRSVLFAGVSGIAWHYGYFLSAATDAAFVLKPRLLASRSFISTITACVYPLHLNTMHYVKRRIDFARRIAEHQFHEVVQGYDRIIIEGIQGEFFRCDPIGLYAARRGLDIAYLDESNPHYCALTDPELSDELQARGESEAWRDETQRKREELWPDVLMPYGSLNRSLLIVGHDHAANRWGFVDKLLKKGIVLKIIKDYEQESLSLAGY